MKNKIKISLITIALIIPLFVRPVLAEGTNVYTWVYGTYTSDFSGSLENIDVGVINVPFGEGTIPIPIVKTRAYQEISFQLSNYMYGAVQIQFSPTTSLNWADIYVSGASINSWNYTTGVLNLGVKGTDHFTVTILSRRTFTAFLTSSLSISVSGSLTSTNSPAYNLNQIDLKLADTNTNLSSILSAIDNLESYTDNLETLLTNIQGYTSYLDDIYSSVQNTYNDVDYYLPLYHSTFNNIYNTLTSYGSILNSILNEDILIYEQLQGLDIYRSLIYQLMTENDRYIQYTNRYRIYGDVYLYDHTKNTSSQDWRNSFYIPSGKTYSFIFYTVGSLGASYNVYSRDGNIVINVYERQIASAKYIYEFNIKNNSGSSNPVAIEFTKDIWFVPIWLGNANLMPIQVQEILGVNYGDMYTAKMQDVISAINNMSVSVNNMTVNATGITYNTNSTQVINSVNNYNTNIDYVYSVENNLSLDFDTYNQQFNPDFTETLQSIQVAPQVMNNILVSLYDIPFIKYPILLTLAGIVLLALLGV